MTESDTRHIDLLRARDDQPLDATIREEFLGAVTASTLEEDNPRLAELAGKLDRRSAAVCAERWVEAWNFSDDREHVPWVLSAGVTGDDGVAQKLGDFILEGCRREADVDWRVDVGLEALRRMGTRGAHMQLQRIASQARVPAVVMAANDMLQRIADERGVRIWHIGDDLVPDCGLDAKGSWRIDYGARRFVLRLDPSLRPFLEDDQTRERHYELPPARHDDDVELVASCERKWRILCEQLDDAIPVQVHRLEQALVVEYRWTREQWVEKLLHHPLMGHLVQRLVWGTYSRGGRLIDTFRVTEERRLEDVHDQPFELLPDVVVGLPHPLQVHEALRDEWGLLLLDYEIATLFPQLDRPTYRHLPEDAKSSRIPVHETFDRQWLYQFLFRRGWRRDDTEWGNTPISKVFRNRDIKVTMHVVENETESTIDTVFFRRYLGHPQTEFHFRDLPPVVYSEAMYVLETLRALAP